MPILSEILLESKKRLKKILADKEVYDVLIFGSAIKGKALPRDIDVCLITHKKIDTLIEQGISGMHISVMKPEEFFTEQPSLAHTLLREGYSLRKGGFLAEGLRFESKVIFIYHLKNKTNTEKVKIVTFLRGKGKEEGIVKERGGTWLARQVFTVPLKEEYLIAEFFRNNAVNYTKNYVLMH